MATNVLMPKLSDTMEEGKILRWLKQPGDSVSAGDVLAEVETDKADMEVEAEAAGTLSEIVVPEGGSAGVGDIIARLGDGTAPAKATGNGESVEAEEESPPARESPASEPDSSEAPDAPPEASLQPARPKGTRSPKASPDAVRMAEEQGIDLAAIEGSGPGGRVVKRDLENAAPARRKEAPTLEARREELSRIRRTVARRMAESKETVPHFYLTVEVRMDECARLKAGLAAARPGEPVSYTHFLMRAATLALLEHPRINARYVPDDAVEFPAGIHLGIAVALEEGLIVPVLHDCQAKDLFTIATEARALVNRVRTGKPHGDDLSGGTFTISNLGMFPVDDFAAIINPPQAAVLAVGALRERPVVHEGNVVAASTMRVTLSSDHRVIDGAEAAQFLESLQKILENPYRLLL